MQEIRRHLMGLLAVGLMTAFAVTWVLSGPGAFTSAERVAPAAGAFGLGLGLFLGAWFIIDRTRRMHVSQVRWQTSTKRDPERPGWSLDGQVLLASDSERDITPVEIRLRSLRCGHRVIRIRRRIENRGGEIWPLDGDRHNPPPLPKGGATARYGVHFYVTDEESRGAGEIVARITVRDETRSRHRGRIRFPAPPANSGPSR
jgi:hypothetical protein